LILLRRRCSKPPWWTRSTTIVRFCCDLSEVTFFGAAGINALVIAHERAARAGSRLLIRGAHGITRRVLQITGLEDLLSGP
jgi:anti-anti-sigma factor